MQLDKVRRFVADPLAGSQLSPAQYMPSWGTKQNSQIQNYGKAAFKTPMRPDPSISPTFDNPGPGEYKTEVIDNILGHKLNHKVKSTNK